MRINTNISSMIGNNQLRSTGLKLDGGAEKLSSGLQVNRGADDPSGLAILTSMKARTGGLTTANQNAQDCISFLQLRDSAMAEINDCINRIRELAVRAANEATLTADDRLKLQAEAGALVNQINQINTTAKFNGKKVFGPSFSEVPGGFGGAIVHPGQTYISVDLASMAVAGVVEIYGAWYDGAAAFPDFNLLSPDGTEAFGYLYATYGAPGVSDFLGDTGTVTAPAITSATSVQYSGYNGYAGSGGWDEESFIITDPAPGQWTIIIDNEQPVPKKYGLFFNTPAVDPEEKDRGQIGAENDENTQVIRLGMFEVSSFALGVSAAFSSTALAQAAISSLDNALERLNDRRADTGTLINRIQHIINDNMAEVINVEASRSRIEDTDMAREIVDYTKSQILSQTGIDATKIANMSGKSVLDLVGITLQSVGSTVG